ncbi:hypothetical protein TNCV_855141 [Trichonephila clavipes]|nr:hypothetical protein TNCV_855141 [Trichonephila clavipes]
MRDETSLAGLGSGHTRTQRHAAGFKVYPFCPKSNVAQASPAHILAGIGCHNRQLLSNSATVLHCLKSTDSWT